MVLRSNEEKDGEEEGREERVRQILKNFWLRRSSGFSVEESSFKFREREDSSGQQQRLEDNLCNVSLSLNKIV